MTVSLKVTVTPVPPASHPVNHFAWGRAFAPNLAG